MKTLTNVPIHDDEVIVLRTTAEGDLDQIKSEYIQAVIYMPPELPGWFAELAAAVSHGSFQVPRTILNGASFEDVEAWLETTLPHGVVTGDVRTALKHDVLALVEREHVITGASRFIFRALTDAPSRHCGFHLDTVPPGVPPWGLLRVYNGTGTDYIDPANVTTIRHFYRYLSRRERLVRDMGEADANSDQQAHHRLLNEIVLLDEERPFLKHPSQVLTAPAGSIIAFKHLDVRLHWSNHAKSLAWLHCSPMAGEPRFLVNVTASKPVGHRSAVRGTDAIAH